MAPVNISQCPDMILNKIEKNFQQDLHRIKEFSSEIPNLFFLKIPAVRAWNPPARQQCHIGPNQVISAVLLSWWIPCPYS